MEQIHTYDETEISFHNFDMHVSKVSASNMTSLAALIEYFKEPYMEDKYKEILHARQFLVWMTQMKANKIEDISDELVAILEDHPTNAFATLCNAANIQHHVIYGIGKNIGYMPGQTEEDNTIIETAWIAFKSQDRWHLVDPQGVMSIVKGYQRGGEILLEHQGKTVLEDIKATKGTKLIALDDFWFCIHPSIFITFCFPNDPEWQLLPSEKQIDKTGFFKTPYMQPFFFLAKLQLLSEEACVLHAENGKCTIKFGADKSRARYTSMIYQLSLRKGTGDLTNIAVNDLPLLVMYAPSIDTFSFHIRFPVAAEYIFNTYVSAPSIDSDSHMNCSEFKIICTDPDLNCKKFPLESGGIGYGFGYAAVDFGLKNPSTHQPSVPMKCSHDNEIEMKELTFQIEDDKVDDIEFSSDIVGDDNSENVVTETRVDEVSGKLHVKAGIKKEGEYALSIIAREKETNDERYTRIINYLLSSDIVEEDTNFEQQWKKRKRELTLQSKLQALQDKKNLLCEQMKAMQSDIDHLKMMYENENNTNANTVEITSTEQEVTETKTSQTEETLEAFSKATQTEDVTRDEKVVTETEATQTDETVVEAYSKATQTEAVTHDEQVVTQTEETIEAKSEAIQTDDTAPARVDDKEGGETVGPIPDAKQSKVCVIL